MRKYHLSLFVFILLLGTFAAAAQEETPSLRDLAEQNGIQFGAAVYTYHLNDPTHVEVLSREFNSLTPENEAKACEVQPELGRFDFRDFDELVAFAEANDMIIHGHTLLWHQCVPSWLENAQFSREEAINAMRDHIYTVVGRYKGRIAIWDVVNEGINDNGAGVRETPWQRLIGDDYIELAFQFAHEADPDALLFYNDYGAEGINAKSNTIYEMAADFVERGIPIHGIGLQAHYTLGSVNAGSLASNMQRIGELGLQVQLTEVDIRYPGDTTDSILRQQATEYRMLLQTCLDNPACTAFITWGVSDNFTWLRGTNLGFFLNTTVQPLLFDDNYQPKPAYFAVLETLAEGAGLEPVTDAEEATEEQVTAVEIPPPTKTDPAQLAPDSVEGLVYYAPYPVTITLDGDTADWANIPLVTVDSGTMLPPDNDTVLTFGVAADEDYLYFLADVQDSVLSYGNHEAASGWYMEDSVEFYLNTTGDLAAFAYEPGIVQIGIVAANITNPETPLIGGSNSGDSQIEVNAVETDYGYRIEARVPLTTEVWEIQPEHLGVLGFQAHLNGASTPDNRDTKLIWSAADTADQSWNNPSLFGQLIFWNVEQ